MPISIASKGDRISFSGLKCTCGGAHHTPSQDLFIGSDMIRKLPRYIKKRELGEKAVLIADQASQECAVALRDSLRREGIAATLLVLQGLVADERAVGEAVLTMRLDTEFFIGIGGRMAAAVTRAAASQTERAYALLPTAPSALDYHAQYARLFLRDKAIKLRAVAPEIVAFDLDILRTAPPEDFAAGLIDLMSCHLARADWAALALIRGDRFCPLCADMAAEACDRALAGLSDIAARNEAGVRLLAEALLTAGTAAYITGSDRPILTRAQRAAFSAQTTGAPYGALLAGALIRLLDAYRAFDGGKMTPENSAFAKHASGLNAIFERLPSGERVRNVMRAVAPSMDAICPALPWPAAPSLSATVTFSDYLEASGLSLFS